MPDVIVVEVIYALPQAQELVRLEVPSGTSLLQAVEMSGLLQCHPELDLATASFGIYARLARPDTMLRDRDRVEIYRQLIADPKEVRRQRAAQGKVTKKGASGAKPRSA